jgi:hypothetical protein
VDIVPDAGAIGDIGAQPAMKASAPDNATAAISVWFLGKVCI